MNGQNFFPIEVAGTLRAGNGGERVRLDLTSAPMPTTTASPMPGRSGSSTKPAAAPASRLGHQPRHQKGDFDGDGTSNFLEYVAGTFAGDATERFELRSPPRPPPPSDSSSTPSPAKSTASSKAPTSRRGRPCPSRSRPPARPSPYRATAVGVLPAYVTTVPRRLPLLPPHRPMKTMLQKVGRVILNAPLKSFPPQGTAA
jgi:hypothetical protein